MISSNIKGIEKSMISEKNTFKHEQNSSEIKNLEQVPTLPCNKPYLEEIDIVIDNTENYLSLEADISNKDKRKVIHINQMQEIVSERVLPSIVLTADEHYYKFEQPPTTCSIFLGQKAVTECVRQDMVRLIVSLSSLNTPHNKELTLNWLAVRNMDIFLSIYFVRHEDIKMVAIASLMHAAQMLKLPPFEEVQNIEFLCSQNDFLALMTNFREIATRSRISKCSIGILLWFCNKYCLSPDFFHLGLMLLEVSLLDSNICNLNHSLKISSICAIISKMKVSIYETSCKELMRLFNFSYEEIFSCSKDLLNLYLKWRELIKLDPFACSIFAKFSSLNHYRVSFASIDMKYLVKQKFEQNSIENADLLKYQIYPQSNQISSGLRKRFVRKTKSGAKMERM